MHRCLPWVCGGLVKVEGNASAAGSSGMISNASLPLSVPMKCDANAKSLAIDTNSNATNMEYDDMRVQGSEQRYWIWSNFFIKSLRYIAI